MTADNASTTSQQESSTIKRPPPSPANGFLPEPFPTVSAANSTRHWHDAFGSDDAGVDYGPPSAYEYEDDEEEEESFYDGINRENYGDDDDDEEEEKSHPTTATKVDPPGNSTPANTINSISIEELEEEVDLHTRTLESISIKLRKIDEEIQKEEEIASSLRNDIQLLNQRKLLLKKRKMKSRKLIEELEGSLQKCAERLGEFVAAGYDFDEHAHDDEEELDSEIEDGDGIPGVLSPSTDDNDHAPVAGNVECDREDSVRQGDVNSLISSTLEHDARGKMIWPSTELVHEIHLAAEELPVDFPSWRTNALSMSFLRGIDSEKMLIDIMNVAALENLVKREEWFQSSEGKSNQRERGVGWINEADIWGTCLDVYTHVNWKSLFAGFQRVDMSLGTDQEAEWPSSTTSKYSARIIDPNITICPYELIGTCADNQCSYQHLGRDNNRQRTSSSQGGTRKGFIRYNNFPKLKLPRLFTRDDFIFVEWGVTSVNKWPTGTSSLHARENTMDEGHEHDTVPVKSHGIGRRQEGQINDSQRYYCPIGLDRREEIERDVRDDSDASHVPRSGDDEDDCGLEFIALPTTITDRAESDSDDFIRGYNKTIFNGRFWWQQIEISQLPPDVECRDTFDCVLLSFGFEMKCSRKNGRASHSLKYIIPKFTSERQQMRHERIDNILHLSRLTDLSRMLVHMGRDSLAMSAMSDYCQSRPNDILKKLAERASCSIKTLLVSRCALSVFVVQVDLLSISEAIHSLYNGYVRCDGDFEGSQLCNLIDQMMLSSCIEDMIETDTIPAEIVKLLDTVRQSIPSSNHCNMKGYDDWNSFIAALRSMMETFVLHLSQMGGDDQLTCLYQSTCVGKILSGIIGVAARRYSFMPLFHVIEPIWGSLQPLLQSTSGCKTDIIGVVIIGPILFQCVAFIIAPPRACARSRKSSFEFDTRDFANVISLDKCMFQILKELNRFGSHVDGRLLFDVLLTPLFALSATVCIAQGSLENANARLEHLFSDSAKETKRPAVYAFSEIIWSQLVQIQMLCPPHGVSLNSVRNTVDTFNAPILPDEILMFHHEIASGVSRNGIYLWGVTLRGDSHMNMISPCFSRKHYKEWEKVAAHIFNDFDWCDEIDCEVSVVKFHSSNPFPELIGSRVIFSVFPETLLLLADNLISLNLENCALISLPSSLGYQIPLLRLLNVSYNFLSALPASICSMTSLENMDVSYNKLKIFPDFISQCSNLRVLNVSYNQLESVPTELALRCHNLQALLLDGNPATTSSGCQLKS